MMTVFSKSITKEQLSLSFNLSTKFANILTRSLCYNMGEASSEKEPATTPQFSVLVRT